MKCLFTNKHILVSFSIVLLSIDQLSKHIIRQVGGFYICNKGVAFGIKVPEILLTIFLIMAISTASYTLYKKYFIHNTLYLMLIFSGALSNIIDRLYFGCVIDFIDLKFWPVFNLADVYITIGGIMLIFNQRTVNKKQ